MSVHIAIAEDNSYSLSALRKRLQEYSDVVIKIIAGNGKELLEQLNDNHNIDLILMDIEMPEMNGLEATKEVSRRYPHIKILVLTMFDNDEILLKAIMAGASGYLLKESNAVEIYKGIMDTLSGGSAMSPAIAMKVIQLVRNPQEPEKKRKDYGLTQRESELLIHLKNGLTYEEIASNLNISYHTVRKHIENIYRKLQVNNKVEAVQKTSE